MKIALKKISLLTLTVVVIVSLSSYVFIQMLQENNNIIITKEFIYEEAPFPSCHASTIAETPEGLIAAWFGGTHEKHEDVEIWVSRRANGKWSSPVSVANGIQHEDKRYPTWNPVLYQVPEGPLMLFYKVGPNPQEWWGMLTTSNDHGKSWSKPGRLPEDILGPIKNKPVMLEDETLISPSSTENKGGEGWRVHFEITEDLGKTWKIVSPVNDGQTYNVIQPSILKYGNGRLQMLARSMENQLISSWSEDYGRTWGKLTPTTLPNPNSGTDAVTLNNGWQLLVYNPTVKTEGKWGGPRTPLNVAVSKDGHTWKSVLVLEEQPGEYSYPAVIQAKDNIVHITYTWKREKIKHVALDIYTLKFDKLIGMDNNNGPE
jgi:predicted neuraminidase